MAQNNLLNFNDAFANSVELTAAIQRTPYNPGQSAKLKLFTESGIVKDLPASYLNRYSAQP